MSVYVDGVEYVPKREIKEPKAQPQVDARLYDILDRLRTDISQFRDSMQRPRLQSDVDELDRMAATVNHAIGILIRTQP